MTKGTKAEKGQGMKILWLGCILFSILIPLAEGNPAPPLRFDGIESATPGYEYIELSWSSATGGTPPYTYNIQEILPESQS